MYEKIAGTNPYKQPMMIYPAVHYTMGGLWVDYNLQSNSPGLHVLGEANFSDHGANRLGASALMQGLADGYFVIPTTVANYLATQKPGSITNEREEFTQAEKDVKDTINRLMTVKGTKSVDHFHREMGLLTWNKCGMDRRKEGLEEAIVKIKELREEFWKDVRIPGSSEGINMELEKAMRVADFLEFAEMLYEDALNRNESCGGHFRGEYQFTDQSEEVKSGKTQPGEALRDDDNFCYVAAWEYAGYNKTPILHKEDLAYENIKLAIRSYA